MSYDEVLNLPWVTFILGMLDAPHIDYESKKKKEEVKEPETAEDEANALLGLFK